MFVNEYETPWNTHVSITHLARDETTEHVASTKKLIRGPGCVMVVTSPDGGRDQHIVYGCSIDYKD